MKLSYRLSHSAIPASADAEALLLVTILAPLGKIARRPVNLGVALDRSGSMSGEPLAIAKAALGQFVDQLLPEDRLTIVAFDDLATPVVTGQKASDKAAIRTAIAGIDIGGMTNLSAGWLSTSDIVASAADPGTYSRIVVLSDGHANAGITNAESRRPPSAWAPNTMTPCCRCSPHKAAEICTTSTRSTAWGTSSPANSKNSSASTRKT